jgi:hypothetical protein
VFKKEVPQHALEIVKTLVTHHACHEISMQAGTDDSVNERKMFAAAGCINAIRRIVQAVTGHPELL